MKPLWNHYVYTFCFANSPWIPYFFVISIEMHYPLRDFTRNSSCFSRIHYLFLEFPMDSLSPSRFLFELILFFNSLSSSRFHLELIISPRIHYRFANFLCIHYLLRNFSLNSLSFLQIHYLFREFILNPLSFLRDHYEFAMQSLGNQYGFTISRIYYLFRNLSMKTLSASRFYYEFTVFSANLPWIHYLLRHFTMNSLSISRFHF